MIALLLFSIIAAALVWIAGRKDAALDPKLTTVVLGLLAVFPILLISLPKVDILPVIPNLQTDPSQFPIWFFAPLIIWGIGTNIELFRIRSIAGKLHDWRERSTLIQTINGVEIRKLDGLRGPIAAGVFRKMVFVPADWETWSADRQQIVLDHELAHHRRKDPLRRWIASVAVAMNWFNPLVRWIVRRLMIQCEYACDAEVLKGGVSAKHYATLLCDMAEDTPVRGPALAMAEKSGLESRVRRMMEDHRDQGTMGTSCLILFAVAVAGLLAILGSEKISEYTRQEIDLRRTADPFPGE